MAGVKKKTTAQSVKDANSSFYDAVAYHYEEIDNRRSRSMECWLRNRLGNVCQQTSGRRLLDVGTGAGLLTRCAKGLFSLRIGVDLSSKILDANRVSFDYGVNADVDHLPFDDNSFDAVTCFAVLHHLFEFDGLVSEVVRILKPGGVFYTDHDLDNVFAKRYHFLLMLYRHCLNNAKTKFINVNSDITSELYDLTEWQRNGVDSVHFALLCHQAGFSTTCKFHWFGLTPITDKLFGEKNYAQGWAPLLSVVATKQ